VKNDLINITDIASLEHLFAEDFSTPLFPVLANHYLKDKQLKRARKVCEVGLKHSPKNSDGKFILAKINLYENKIVQSEQLLKQVVEENLVHIKALKILIEVMTTLDRSPNSIIKYVNKLLEILPGDSDAITWLDELEKNLPRKVKIEKISSDKTETKSEQSVPTSHEKTPIKTEKVVFNVGMGMATFTMVSVLKSQKHYRQALLVLSQLEEKGADTKKIKQERNILEELLANE
tara:strand:- start:87 stop:788 length:702 start_codon:yes stop_codon:yes gene_type:complete